MLYSISDLFLIAKAKKNETQEEFDDSDDDESASTSSQMQQVLFDKVFLVQNSVFSFFTIVAIFFVRIIYCRASLRD